MMKRYIAILSIILIVVIQLFPVLKVFATDVTVANTFGDVTYGYTNQDYLTANNYHDYYDEVDGYLKYCANYDAYLNNNDADYGTNTINTVLGNIENINATAYPNVNGKKISLFTYWRSSYSCYYYNLVVDGQDDIFFVDGYLCSKSPFTIKQMIYSCGPGTINGTYTIYTGGENNVFDDTENITYDATNQIYYRNYGGMLFYSEVPIYLSYVQNNEYKDGNYLGQSPYNYQNWVNVAKAVMNDTDNTGFVVDRRTDHMITANGGGQVVSSSQYGFKQGSFGNILYGSDTFNQKLMVGYQLNDASSTIQDDLYLKLNYQYIFDGLIWSQHIYFDEDYYSNAGRYDLYSLSNNNYVNVDLNKIFDTLYENDGDYDTNLGTVLTMAQGSIIQSSQRPQKVLDKTATNLFNILFNNDLLTGYPVSVEYDNKFFDSVSLTYKDITVSPKFNLNAITMGTQSLSYTNRLDNVEIIVTESIYNIKTGEESTPYTFIYNYLDGTYKDLGTLETKNEMFTEYQYGGQSLSSYTADDINFDVAKGQYYPSTQAYGGSSSSSVGDIIVYAGTNTVSKVFIDMPMEEALEHTPNLSQLYSDMKSGFLVSTDNSQSIIQLTKDTYTFIPAEIWGYITICVVTCCGLAVYRNFRGR